MRFLLPLGAEVGDVPARALAGVPEAAGEVVSYERRRVDCVGGRVEAVLDRGAGAVHPFAQHRQAVDSVANLERQEREQNEKQEQEEVAGERRGTARRGVRIEAHA